MLAIGFVFLMALLVLGGIDGDDNDSNMGFM